MTEPRTPDASSDAELDVAKTVADFTVAFDKWSRSLLAADAPSLPRLKLLYALACEGPQRMGDLADILEVTPRTVTALVDGLEAQGQVRRVPDPTDRRATIIEMARGASEVEHRYRDYAAAVAHMFDCVDARDRAEFVRVCRQLTARLRASEVSLGADRVT